MDKIIFREKIIEALSNVSIFIDETEAEDVDLDNYIEDSIHFMTMVIQIEETFDIEFPSELLTFENFSSINSICLLVEEVYKIEKLV